MSALSQGTRIKAYSFDPDIVRIYGFDTDHPAEHPLVDDDLSRVENLDEAMVANIKHRGVIEPIEVTVVGDDIVVINGRRRIVHCRAANKLREAEGLEPWPIKAVTMRGGENSQEHKLAAISANMFRADHGPMAQARKISQLLNAGVSEEEVAVGFGFGVGTVNNRVKLLDLDPKTQKAIEAGQISVSTALEISKLDVAEQVERLQEAIAESNKNGGSLRGQAQTVRRNSAPSDAPTRPSIAKARKMLEFEEVEEVLTEGQIQILRVMTGDVAMTTIKGLKGLYDKACGKKKAPARV